MRRYFIYSVEPKEYLFFYPTGTLKKKINLPFVFTEYMISLMHIGWGDYLSRACRDFLRLLIRAAPFSIFGDIEMRKVNKFKLTRNLRSLLAADAMSKHQLLGYRLPVSVVGRAYHSCTIRIYPEDGYEFFMGCEIARIYNLAKDFDCSSFVVCHGTQIVVEITDYFKDDE